MRGSSLPILGSRIARSVLRWSTRYHAGLFRLDSGLRLESDFGSFAGYLLSRKTQASLSKFVGPKDLVNRSTVLFCCVSLPSPPDFRLCLLNLRPGFWLLVFSIRQDRAFQRLFSHFVGL